MRIIAGSCKGRRLVGPTGPGLRPTSDSLRETLFNILGPSVLGAAVLDGFAGTGALGLEALSRGAAHATFVEQDRRATALLQENIRRCGVEGRSTIVRSDFLRAAAGFGFPEPRNLGTPEPRPSASSGRPERVEGRNLFDFVFLDPPYDVKDLEAVASAAAPLVAPGGRLVLEHSRRRDTPAAVEPLQRTRLVIAGDSALSLYQ